MNDSTANDQERTGSHDCPRLGVDTRGCQHYYDDAHDRVLVTADGDVVDVVALDGRSLATYRQFVADHDDREWAAWLGEQFGEQVAALAGEC